MSESSEKEVTDPTENQTADLAASENAAETNQETDQAMTEATTESIENETVVDEVTPTSEDVQEEDDSDVLEHNPTGPAGYRENPELAKTLAMAAAKVCYDNFAKDVVVLDMSGKTALFDYFVVATGTSRRHLHAISEEIDDVLEKELHDKRMSREGYEESRWIVLDYGCIVIHLFDDETRSYYSLEALHADSPKLDIKHLQPKGYKE